MEQNKKVYMHSSIIVCKFYQPLVQPTHFNNEQAHIGLVQRTGPVGLIRSSCGRGELPGWEAP
jgi:hypothetical protein